MCVSACVFVCVCVVPGFSSKCQLLLLYWERFTYMLTLNVEDAVEPHDQDPLARPLTPDTDTDLTSVLKRHKRRTIAKCDGEGERGGFGGRAGISFPQ